MLDLATQRLEQLAHHVDIGDIGHVSQTVLARSEQAGRHLLQHRVLRPEGLHVAFEGSGGLDDE